MVESRQILTQDKFEGKERKKTMSAEQNVTRTFSPSVSLPHTINQSINRFLKKFKKNQPIIPGS